MPRHDLAAAIIAGGRATRFAGQDKSRLVIDGRPIIVRQVEVLQRVASTITVIGAPPDRYADLHIASCPDSVDGAGALGGIYSALVTSQAPTVLVVACDMPFLDGPLLARLADLAKGHDGAWVRTARGVEPLMACYQTRVAPVIQQRIATVQLKAAGLGDVLDIAEMGPDELATFGPPDHLLANVNTPDEYARVQYGVS